MSSIFAVSSAELNTRPLTEYPISSSIFTPTEYYKSVLQSANRCILISVFFPHITMLRSSSFSNDEVITSLVYASSIGNLFYTGKK